MPDPRREALEEVDATLTERSGPVTWSELLPEERREVQDRIGRAADETLQALALGYIESGPIGELLAVAKELGRKPQWVYHFLVDKTGAKAINIMLIHEIVRQLGWKPGAAWFWIKQLRQGIEGGEYRDRRSKKVINISADL